MAETAGYNTSQAFQICLPSDNQLSLSQQINASSRSTHSKLNRLIVARLPLALPPRRTEPSTYISGLLHIAAIYITFETLWACILETPCPLVTSGNSDASDRCEPESHLLESQSVPLTRNIGDVPPKHPFGVCARRHTILADLRLPGLLRSGRLRADIRSITGMSEQNVNEQVEEVSRTGKTAEFITHAQESIKTNPHVILAYAWVLYMALFSGGRFIRKSLKAAGPEFWMSLIYQDIDINYSNEQVSIRSGSGSSAQGFQFLSFDGELDGEETKSEFKRRITEAEILLTDEEKRNIVQESQHIFRYMVEIVSELDAITGNASLEL